MWVLTLTTTEWSDDEYNEVGRRMLSRSKPIVDSYGGGNSGPLFFHIETDNEVLVMRGSKVSSIRCRQYHGDGPPPPPGVIYGVPQEGYMPEGEVE